MNLNPLQVRLRPAVRRHGRVRLWCQLAAVWAAAAAVGLLVFSIQQSAGSGFRGSGPLLALAAVAGSVVVLVRHGRRKPDFRVVAQAVEGKHPELRGLLLTAVQQVPDETGQFSFLQERLMNDATDHGVRHRWIRAIPFWWLGGAHALHLAALAGFVAVLATLRAPVDPRAPSRLKLAFTGLEVTPGDVSIERGNSLVVLARFGAPPKDAELVLSDPTGATRRLPLTRSLADPVFGGSVPDVSSNFTYRVEYGTARTRDFQVSVFEHPKLERADVDLTFPAYTGQSPKHIEDTRRLSAVQGTRVELALQLNKPVASATLVPRETAGTNAVSLRLAVGTNLPTAALTNFNLAVSATYDLRLVDAEGRTNKVAAQFVLEALPNRVPEMKVASPRGDVRPSALEELTFTGTVWDDFGVSAYGLAFTQVGHETQYVELGRAVAAKVKQPFQHLLRLEDLGAQPDQVVAWFVWADDLGPDGQVRRTTGDMFFAEIRPFEETFREGQGGGEQEGEESKKEGSPTTKLAELQKQIINATWKLQREQAGKPGSKGAPPKPATEGTTPAKKTSALGRPSVEGTAEETARRIDWRKPAQFMAQRARSEPAEAEAPGASRSGRRAASSASKKPPAPVRYEDDLAVIRSSAEQAIEKAKGTMERQTGPGAKTLWSAAIAQMERSLDELDKAKDSPAALADALAAQQSAYQTLLKLQERDTTVTRSKSRSPGQGEQRNQRQLDELDLPQAENRYETQRQADTPEKAERREELQILNRLQELARRQEDVNERLKELQTSLQAANTEKEREELRRQLKRLEEQQQQQLADMDELQQRMNRPENQSRLNEQRQQVEKAREELQRAAEAAGEGKVGQALASGTRAQRQLQETRDQLRKQTSGEFSEEMRTMRAEARELARKEDEIAKKLAALEDPKRKSLSDSGDRQAVLDQLAQQKARMTNLLDRATQVSQAAEASEPLVSRQLHDAIRKFSQTEASNVKQLQEDLIRRGMMSQGLYQRMQETAAEEGAKSLELAAEMLRQGYEAQAGQAERRARAGIDTLKQGVERAAEKVLGDDSQALRMAQEELESLTQQLERELAPGAGDAAGNPQAGGGRPGGTNSVAQAGPGRGQRGSKPGEASGPDAQSPPPPGEGQPGEGTGSPAPEAGTTRGESPSASAQNASPGKSPGKSPGQSAAPGEEPGSSPAPSSAESAQSKGAAKGQGQGQGQGQRQGSPSDSPGQPAPANQAQRGAKPGAGRGQRGGLDLDILAGGRPSGGGDASRPITGEDFAPWADRLRDVEEMVDQPELRSGVANAREQARLMRLEYRKDLKKPDWAKVQLKVVKPLVEVSTRIREELARRTTGDSLVPIDRDPVPTRYSELVRRYYEDLGKDK